MVMNDYWIWKKGQVGITRRGYLSDANGRVNLNIYDTVKVTVRRTPHAVPVIDRASCVPDANQNEENALNGKGWLTFTTDSNSGNIPVHTGYLLEFECMRGAITDYYPMKEDNTRTYGRLVVQKPL